MDIRKNKESKLNPIEIQDILHRIERLPWVKNLIKEYIELLNLCENEEEKDLVNNLVDHFTVLDLHMLSSSLKDIKTKITSDYQITHLDTFFYAFSDNSKPDGSQLIIQAFKNKFLSQDGWSESNFSNNLLDINSHQNKYKNIFLVDDFIGTGNTAISKYRYAKSRLQVKGIKYKCLVVIAVAGMEFSKDLLEQDGIPYFCPYWLKKGISENYPIEEIENKKRIMIQIESRLDNRKGRAFFPFGFEQSEALFSIEEMNIPDNVFPVFWWPYGIEGLRETMFKGLR